MMRTSVKLLALLVSIIPALCIPDAMAESQLRLRCEGGRLSDTDVKFMLVKFNFFDRTKNTNGAFPNDLVDNGDGTVTDRATGLMWQKRGSDEGMTWPQAGEYVKSLDRDRFAGHPDWRMPTIEELASLMKSARARGLHIDPVFSDRQACCWSADIRSSDIAWYANFKSGILMYSYHFFFYVRAVRSPD